MNKKFRLWLLISLGAVAASCFAAGCKVGPPSREETLAPYKGGLVTYYANGGIFDNSPAITVREVYFKENGVPFFDADENTSAMKITYSGYDFTGWYLPERYTEGEHEGEIKFTYTYKEGDVTKTVPAYLLKDENGEQVTDKTADRPLFYREGSDEEILEKQVRIVPSQEAVDSSRIISSGDALTVCATWKPSLKFVYKLAGEPEKEYAAGEKTYKHGDVIHEMPFGRDSVKHPGTLSNLTLDGMTFIANYTDEACTQIAGDITRPEDGSVSEITIWCKYLEGKWTVIRNSVSDIVKMFSGLTSSSNKYYLLEDVDCASASAMNPKPSAMTVNATIEGNGHTLSNLKFTNTQTKNGAQIAALFGTIGASAKIRNLTLKDVTVTLSGIGDLTLYAVCNDIKAGAVVEGLKIEGITAEVDVSGLCFATDAHWLFGAAVSDEQFLKAHTGITVTGATLNVKNKA